MHPRAKRQKVFCKALHNYSMKNKYIIINFIFRLRYTLLVFVIISNNFYDVLLIVVSLLAKNKIIATF